MRKILKTILAGTALSFAAAVASAATVTVGTTGFTPGTLIAADATTGTVFENATGSVSGLRADPWAATDFAGTGAYTSVSGGATATYALGSTRTSYDFLWGTPDGYNTLVLLLGGVAVDSIAGDMTGIVDFADQTTNRFVTVSSTSAFDGLRFESGANAFEFAAIAPVPLPAAGGLLMLALGGLAMVRRRAAKA